MRCAVALNLQHRLDDGFGAGGVTQAPAGHRIRLRQAVHHNGAVGEVGRNAQPARVVVDEENAVIQLIGEDDDVGVPARPIGNCSQLAVRIHHAGGVRWRVENEQARVRSGRCFELFGGDFEVLRCAGEHQHGFAFGQHHLLVIAHPVRRRNDDLAAGFDQRIDCEIDRLLAAVVHAHLRRLVIDAGVLLLLGGNGFFELGSAAGGGVFGEIGRDGFDAGVLDRFRCGEIRLAGAKADHRLALASHLLHAALNGHGCRRRDLGHALAESILRHGMCLLVARSILRESM